MYAFTQKSDRASPRQTRQLSYIAQFATQISYLAGGDNCVADPLSRIEAIRLPTQFELSELSAEQEKDAELRQLLESSEHSLTLKRLTWGPSHTPIYCDISEDSIRPYLPESLHTRAFSLFHSAAHPSAKVTDRLIRQRYVWKNMHRDIARMCKECLDCQQSKITRHVKFVPDQFIAPDGRFMHVHLDIVGPLPTSEGFQYCLTMIDRFSRWPEAVPLRDTSAQTVARAFFETWVSRFGAAEILTTDQGEQFESQLFSALLSLIGCKRIRTTAYHLAANGMVERWHRDLKAAIMCHTKQWSRVLSTILLGLRTRVRLDTNACPADFVYGTALRIPGEFFLPDDTKPNPHYFLEEFREFMKEVRPVPVTHRQKRKAFVYKDLGACTHVFMLNKPIKKALERPYAGPYKVLERISDRVYSILINNKPRTVSVKLLKPAYFLADEVSDQEPISTNDSNNSSALRTYAPKKKVLFAACLATPIELRKHVTLAISRA